MSNLKPGRSLKSVVQQAERAAYERMSKNEGTDDDIILGAFEDFDADEFDDFGCLLIHHGIVYLTKTPVSKIHEICHCRFSEAVAKSFSSINEFKSAGRTPVWLSNYLGCGKQQWKMPDSSFKIVNAEQREDPVLVIEVACANESLRTLLIEGAMWLNGSSETVYAILIKIYLRGQTFRAKLFVCARTDELQLFNGKRSDEGRQIPPSPRPKLSRNWVANPSDPSAYLERLLGIRIIHREVINDETREIRFTVDANEIYRGMLGFDPLASNPVDIVVPEDSINELKKLFYRRSQRRQ